MGVAAVVPSCKRASMDGVVVLVCSTVPAIPLTVLALFESTNRLNTITRENMGGVGERERAK